MSRKASEIYGLILIKRTMPSVWLCVNIAIKSFRTKETDTLSYILGPSCKNMRVVSIKSLYIIKPSPKILLILAI